MSFYDLPVYNNHDDYNKKKFHPYAKNGGSVVAIAGDDYALIGTDTRLSDNYSIYTRKHKKLMKLSDYSVLGVSGCWCDALTLGRLVQARVQMYKFEHNKAISTPALAQMLATMLYYKRFFPYFVMNILAGLDADGKGCVFSYDPIGHCERSMFKACGSAGTLVQPLLDNQIGQCNMRGMQGVPEVSSVSKEKALEVLKDGFISAAERNIYTGDSVDIMTITSDGIECEEFDLRKD